MCVFNQILRIPFPAPEAGKVFRNPRIGGLWEAFKDGDPRLQMRDLMLT